MHNWLQAIRQDGEHLRAESREGVKALRQDAATIQAALKTLRQEAATLRADVHAVGASVQDLQLTLDHLPAFMQTALERHATTKYRAYKDGPLTVGVRNFLRKRRLEWFTSGSIADALHEPDIDAVIRVLRTLVESWQVTNRCRGLATFYKLECQGTTDLLRALQSYPKGCTHAQLEGRWPDMPGDFLVDWQDDAVAGVHLLDPATSKKVRQDRVQEALSCESRPALEEVG